MASSMTNTTTTSTDCGCGGGKAKRRTPFTPPSAATTGVKPPVDLGNETALSITMRPISWRPVIERLERDTPVAWLAGALGQQRGRVWQRDLRADPCLVTG